MSEPRRRPRKNGIGGKLTVFKDGHGWQVKYVSEVDQRGVVWDCSLPPHTTGAWGRRPFETWRLAMDHAATLRTWYGDQCRGDNLIFDQKRAAK